MTSYHAAVTGPSWRCTSIGVYSCLVTRCILGNSFFSFILKTSLLFFASLVFSISLPLHDSWSYSLVPFMNDNLISYQRTPTLQKTSSQPRMFCFRISLAHLKIIFPQGSSFYSIETFCVFFVVF